MKRVLEPEVMDEPGQALAYARADFAAVNQGFVDRFLALFPDLRSGDVADLGCGPADIPLRLASARSGIRCLAVDASLPMLAHARADARRRELAGSVVPIAARVGALPFADGRFAAILSNSLLHHLPEPALLWSEIRRLARRGAAVLVMDLHRPPSTDAARAIVDRHSANEPEVLRRDFFHSLLAACTLEEVLEQIGAAGLDLAAEVASDRHWVAWGRLP